MRWLEVDTLIDMVSRSSLGSSVVVVAVVKILEGGRSMMLVELVRRLWGVVGPSLLSLCLEKAKM